MSITIEPAELTDIPWLRTQAQAFSDHYASMIPLYPGDDHATTFLEALITSHVVFIAWKPDGSAKGEPVGFIAGMLAPHPMNPAILTLCELLWWVMPEHRGSKAGLLLLDAYTHYGVTHAQWTTCSLEASTKVNAKSLTKRGYRVNETSYFLETP